MNINKMFQLARKLIQKNIFRRILWTYGIYVMLNLFAFAFGYLLLPEGILRNSPFTILGKMVVEQQGFWPQFLSTFGFNFGLVLFVGVGSNILRMKGLPMGYYFIFVQGILYGLFAGTNSFLIPRSSPYSLESWFHTLRVGYLEFFGYTCIVAATVEIGLRNYSKWFAKESEAEKIKNWRDVKFTRQELYWFIIGIASLVIAAYNESIF